MIALKGSFKHRNVDPCLIMRRNDIGTVIIIIYVDDLLSIRDRK